MPYFKYFPLKKEWPLLYPIASRRNLFLGLFCLGIKSRGTLFFSFCHYTRDTPFSLLFINCEAFLLLFFFNQICIPLIYHTYENSFFIANIMGTTLFSILIFLCSSAFWLGNIHWYLILLTPVMVSGISVDFYASPSTVCNLIQKRKENNIKDT